MGRDFRTSQNATISELPKKSGPREAGLVEKRMLSFGINSYVPILMELHTNRESAP